VRQDRSRAGSEGADPRTPVRPAHDEEDAELILLIGEMTDAMRARIFGHDAKVPGRVQLEVQERVWRWFTEHPGETVHLRRGVPGEVLCLAHDDDDLIIESRLRSDGFIQSRALSAEERVTCTRLSPD
jgi:hypothetical protein